MKPQYTENIARQGFLQILQCNRIFYVGVTCIVLSLVSGIVDGFLQKLELSLVTGILRLRFGYCSL